MDSAPNPQAMQAANMVFNHLPLDERWPAWKAFVDALNAAQG